MGWDFRVYAGSEQSVAVATASTSAISLSASAGTRVLFCMRSADAAIRWGSSSVAAATAGNFPLIANQYLVFDVPPNITHFRVIRAASTSGTLHYAVVA